MTSDEFERSVIIQIETFFSLKPFITFENTRIELAFHN